MRKYLLDTQSPQYLSPFSQQDIRDAANPALSGDSQPPQHFAAVQGAATRAGQHKSNLTLIQGLRKYPKAAAWSVLLSTALIMEGYDTSLMGSFYAFPEFRRTFGHTTTDGTNHLSTAWQTGLLNGAAVGSIIGLMINGYLCDKFGYRKTMIWALLFMTGAIFVPFFATSIIVLEVGQCFSGIPLGMFSTLAVAYASDVCPTSLRGYLTAYANISWVLGQILASAVLKGLLHRPDQWGYKIAFALQWIFPLPIMIGMFFAPESPWWLVRHGRVEEASLVIRRLASNEAASDEYVRNTLCQIQLTNQHEIEVSSGTSFLDCVKGVDRRRTEIACATWAVQSMCGSAFMGYSTYFYEQAGLSIEHAYTLSMVQYVLALIGTTVAWGLMTRYGRATLYISGLCGLTLILLGIGGCGITESNAATSWAVGGLLIAFTFVYNCTVGPVCYTLVSEGSSTRLRGKTIVIARSTYQLCSIFINSVLPLMLNPLAWDWEAKTGFFWAGINVFCLIWCIFRLPEFKDRSYHELNILFENQIHARKFVSTEVDALDGSKK